MNIRPFLLSGWNDLDPSTPQRGRALALAQVTASMASTAWVVAVACCLGSHFGTLPNAGGFASCWPAAALALVAVLWRGSWALPGVPPRPAARVLARHGPWAAPARTGPSSRAPWSTRAPAPPHMGLFE